MQKSFQKILQKQYLKQEHYIYMYMSVNAPIYMCNLYVECFNMFVIIIRL